MKKRNQLIKNKNVIHFPGLEKRLLEKGQENLQQKNYHEAIALFEQAIKLAPSNSDCYVGLLLAYFDAGMLRNAKRLAKQMLQESIGNYIEVMNLYLMLLVQMYEYEEVITAIEGLLEENHIPNDKLEHFYQMLHFSREMRDAQPVKETEDLSSDRLMNRELNLFQCQDPQEQMVLAAKLANQNIQPYLHEMTAYLQSDLGIAFFKTLLLNVLKEHQFDKQVEIQKFKKTITVIPAKLFDLDENPQLSGIIEEVRRKLENDDPVLFEHIQTIIKRQFFLLYPLLLKPEDVSVWAAAYHALGNEYCGKCNTSRELMEEYHVLEPEMKKAESFIRMVEENSYPNI